MKTYNNTNYSVSEYVSNRWAKVFMNLINEISRYVLIRTEDSKNRNEQTSNKNFMHTYFHYLILWLESNRCNQTIWFISIFKCLPPSHLLLDEYTGLSSKVWTSDLASHSGTVFQGRNFPSSCFLLLLTVHFLLNVLANKIVQKQQFFRSIEIY